MTSHIMREQGGALHNESCTMTLRGGVYREGLLVSDLHHVIHNIKVNGSWDGVLADALTLQSHHTLCSTMPAIHTINA